MVWARDADYIHAVNVTDRYTQLAVKAPEGMTKVYFRVMHPASGQRVAAKLKLSEKNGTRSWEGVTNDEGFDANDHLGIYLPIGAKIDVAATVDDKSQGLEISVGESTTVTIVIK